MSKPMALPVRLLLLASLSFGCDGDDASPPPPSTPTVSADLPPIRQEPVLPEGFSGSPRDSLPLTDEELAALEVSSELIRSRTSLDTPAERGFAVPAPVTETAP